MCRFKTLILLILSIFLSSEAAYAVSSRAECNFDTILDQSYFFTDRFRSQNLYESESDVGWRVGYALQANPLVNVYIGHNFSPDTVDMTQLEYLTHIDYELTRIQTTFANQGFESSRLILLDQSPYKWGVVSQSNYNAIPFVEEYYHYQVGNKCNFLVLKRYPYDFSDNQLLSIINTELENFIQLAYDYIGPVQLMEESNAPSGFLALLFGVMLPMAFGGAIYMLFNNLSIYGSGVLTVHQKLVVISPQIIAYLYLIGDFVIDFIDNNRTTGFELTVFYVLGLIGIMSWGIFGRKFYVPASISLSSFALSIMYMIMGWSYNYAPFLAVAVFSLVGVVHIVLLAKISEEDKRIKRTQKSEGIFG